MAADPVYIEKYAVRFLRSIREKVGSETLIHFHVIGDLGAPLQSEIRNQLQAEGRDSILLTERYISLKEMNLNQRKALFSSERFLFLAELLIKYRTTILVSDIDVLCLQDPRGLLDSLGGYDLGYTNFVNTIEAWERYSATVLFFNPTIAAIEFLRKMSDILLSTFSVHPQPWFMDQIALFRLMEEFPSNVRSKLLEKILTDSDVPSDNNFF